MESRFLSFIICLFHNFPQLLFLLLVFPDKIIGHPHTVLWVSLLPNYLKTLGPLEKLRNDRSRVSCSSGPRSPNPMCVFDHWFDTRQVIRQYRLQFVNTVLTNIFRNIIKPQVKVPRVSFQREKSFICIVYVGSMLVDLTFQ